jgi:F-type H+-transporting ATPase subunit b
MFTLLSEGNSAFSLITPDPGLAIWSFIIFVTLWVILGKFAFKPIVNALKEREDSIDTALKSAETAKAEMAALTSKNEALLIEAKEERNRIIAEAKIAGEKLKNEIVSKAASEADAKIQQALREIETQKKAAIAEVKNEVASISLDIAEKILRRELKGSAEQQAYVGELLKETSLN